MTAAGLPPTSLASQAGQPAQGRALAPEGGVDRARVERLRAHLDRLYPSEQAAECHRRLVAMLDAHVEAHGIGTPPSELFDQRDVMLITYADQVREAGRAPLRTLREVLDQHLSEVVGGVHLLPFYPWSSDDGFAVTDFHQVDPDVGSWEEVRALAGRYRLMVDAVVNHASSASRWFARWRDGDPAYDDFFVTVEPGEADLSRVVRPREHPLLTPVRTARGVEHVWTTFSADQPDLNYRNPEVLLEVTRALLRYLANGARIVRLDAVAFLWKEPGTRSVHLPQTHELVRLWRTVVDAVSPGTLLITETNVPHHENVAYFGSGHDEAHLVYQFALPPLVLHAVLREDATVLADWAARLAAPSSTTTFFNFLGSHDGIGVRPAEGILPDREIEWLGEQIVARGGLVSARRMADGSLGPYELNTVFYEALNDPWAPEPRARQLRRALAAQATMSALAGVPGVYVHALLGSRNWHAGVRRTGRARTINRRTFERGWLERRLADPTTLRSEVLGRLGRLIKARRREPAFHPNGSQRVVACGSPAVLALVRGSLDGRREVLCLHSLSGAPQPVVVDQSAWPRLAGGARGLVDLLGGGRLRCQGDGTLRLVLGPYQARWLLAVD